MTEDCGTCKFKKRTSTQQPCKFCIEEGYGRFVLYKKEVDKNEERKNKGFF